jgi:8-oxo-dGTP pyrophosphatase MutT (NUDIX family)
MPLEGVSIILRNDAGEVLLVRHSYAGRRWTLPGGGVHRGEPPEQTARREMREELGCGLHDLALLRVMHERISGSPHTAHIFTARSADPVNVDGREVTEAAWFRPDALPDGMGPIARARLSALLEQR